MIETQDTTKFVTVEVTEQDDDLLEDLELCVDERVLCDCWFEFVGSLGFGFGGLLGFGFGGLFGNGGLGGNGGFGRGEFLGRIGLRKSGRGKRLEPGQLGGMHGPWHKKARVIAANGPLPPHFCPKGPPPLPPPTSPPT